MKYNNNNKLLCCDTMYIIKHAHMYMYMYTEANTSEQINQVDLKLYYNQYVHVIVAQLSSTQ